jgi:dihydroneopterin aldolase
VSDVVRIEGLAIDAEIGAFAHERGRKQRLLIDIGIETDVRDAAAHDALEWTVDYDRAAQIAREVALSKHHALIETVAERIASRILDELGARASSVSVRVEKPGAVPDARTVAVEIRRTRA